MQKWAERMNRKNVEKIELTTIANAMIRVASIAQLVFTSIHVKALLLLENEICGFVTVSYTHLDVYKRQMCFPPLNRGLVFFRETTESGRRSACSTR